MTLQTGDGLFVGRLEEHADHRTNYVALPEPQPHIAPDRRPTMLVAGASDSGDNIARWGARAGLRCLGRVRLSEVIDRLSEIAMLDLLLLDLRGMDVAAVLDRATALAISARHGFAHARLAVIVDMEGLDCAIAMLDTARTDFLCQPADSDIVSLLVMAGLAQPGTGGLLFDDTARDSHTARLEQLSDEVRRLAETIERMSTSPPLASSQSGGAHRRGSFYGTRSNEGHADARPREPRDRHRSAESTDGSMPTHAELRAIIRARRMRDHYLPADLFADPAWDMILDLMAARLAGQCVSVSSLCIAAAVPPTTALRWIRQLTDRGVFARIDDPADGRRVFIELTDSALEAVLAWVQAVRRNGGVLAGNTH